MDTNLPNKVANLVESTVDDRIEAKIAPMEARIQKKFDSLDNELRLLRQQTQSVSKEATNSVEDDEVCCVYTL